MRYEEYPTSGGSVLFRFPKGAARTAWALAALLVTLSVFASACAHDSNGPDKTCNPGDPNYPGCLD
jgi:hypothetical protein